MSISASTLDPEVALLLKEVVEDPRSCLNRTPREPLARWVERREGAVSASEPFMSRAERHLVRVHREEIAHLLCLECQRTVLDGPYNRQLNRKLNSEYELVVPETDVWSTQAAQYERSAFAALGDAAELLRTSKRETTVTGSQLAFASLRLVPRDGTRNWLGEALVQESAGYSALQVFGNILDNTSDELDRVLSHLNSGFAWLTLGQVHNSWTHYRRSAHTPEEFPLGQVYWMTSALWLGNRRDFLAAATQVEDHRYEIEHVIDQCRETLRPKNWLVTFPRHGKKTLTESLDRIPETARRILDVIL